jgi:hypothetical protein
LAAEEQKGGGGYHPLRYTSDKKIYIYYISRVKIDIYIYIFL